MIKIKYLLPLAQMAVAAALFKWDEFWSQACQGVWDVPGPSGPMELLWSINPVLELGVIPRYFDRWYFVAQIVVVGLLWYWIALNISSWRQRRDVLAFSWRPARFVSDAVLIWLGLVLGVAPLRFADYIFQFGFSKSLPDIHSSFCFGPNLWNVWLPSIFIPGAHLAWSLLLVFCFGRDLIQCIRRAPARVAPTEPRE